jgi:hypothetical protein
LIVHATFPELSGPQSVHLFNFDETKAAPAFQTFSEPLFAEAGGFNFRVCKFTFLYRQNLMKWFVF